MQGGSVAVPASVSLALAAPRARSYGRRSYGRSKSYGRGRSYSRGGNYYRQRAGRRRAYIAGKYPKAQWAHPWVERGTAQAEALGIGPAGKSYAEVTPSQQARRKQIGWYGLGDYAQPDSEPVMTGRALDGTLINLGKNKQMIRSEIFLNVISPPVQGQQQIQNFDINIGLDEMFPMGSQFANNYRKYRITQLAFTYKNMLPQSQTTNQVGQVSLSFNPDVGEENDMTTNMQIANDQSTVTCNANEDVTLFCEMDPARGAPNQFLNIRNKALRVTQDPSDFDFGVFTLTLAGFPLVPAAPTTSYQIGRVSVSYCVELQHEQINTAMGSSIDQDLFLRPRQLIGIPASPYLPTEGGTFWSQTTLLRSENNVGCVLTNIGLNASNAAQLSIQWPATAFGYYQIELSYESAPLSAGVSVASVSSLPQISLQSNGTVAPVFDLLNTSAGTQYQSTFSGSAVAPTGSAIVGPGDPYCYGNGAWYFEPQSTTVLVTANTVYRANYTFHVYVPGVSSNAPSSTFPAGGTLPVGSPTGLGISSPIQLFLLQSQQTFGNGLLTFSEFMNPKIMLRVTEYNSTMRLKLNGTSDQPYTTNFAGVPTLVSAAAW